MAEETLGPRGGGGPRTSRLPRGLRLGTARKTREGGHPARRLRAGGRAPERPDRARLRRAVLRRALSRETVKEAFDVATAVDEGAYLVPAGADKHDTVICATSEESQGAQSDAAALPRARAGAAELAGRAGAVAEVVRLIGFERRRCVRSAARGRRKDGRGARRGGVLGRPRQPRRGLRGGARRRADQCVVRGPRAVAGEATTPSKDASNVVGSVLGVGSAVRLAAHAGGAPRPGPPSSRAPTPSPRRSPIAVSPDRRRRQRKTASLSGARDTAPRGDAGVSILTTGASS